MNQLKKLAHDTITYGLSSIVSRLLNYFLVPFYTSVLLPSEYGIITELYAYLALLNILYTYGMETAYLKFTTVESSEKIFSITNSILLLTSVIFSSILISIAHPLVIYLGYPGKEIYIYCMAGILFLDTFCLLPFARLRLLNKAMHFAKLRCWQIGVNVLLNLLFLYIFPKVSTEYNGYTWQCSNVYSYLSCDHIVYIFLANILGNMSVLPWLGVSWKHFTVRLEFQQVKKILVYGLPLLVMGLAGMINEMLSRVLLKHILPSHLYPGQSKEVVLGIFGACYKLAMFMALATQAFRYAVEPFFFKNAVEKHSLSLFSKVMQGYIFIGCWVWFAISVNLDLLALIFLRNPAYRQGINIVPYLTLSYLWLGIYYNLSIWFKVVNKNYYGTIITIIGATVTVVLNLYLVPHWGYFGSVLATLCSYISMGVICYYQGQKYYPVPYRVWNGLLMICITAMLIILVDKWTYACAISTVVRNIILTVIYGGIVYKYIRKLA